MHSLVEKQYDEKYYMQKYTKYNNIINDNIYLHVSTSMMTSKRKWILFYKLNPTRDYDYLFCKYNATPYNKTILCRLKEIFRAPIFTCAAKYKYSYTHDNGKWVKINYYIVYIKYNEINQCDCIIS